MVIRAVQNGTMFVELHDGDAPGLLMLHGWGRTRQDLAPCAKGNDAVLVDFPGFGSSPVPPSAWGAEEYSECVAAALTELGSGPRVVVAHSFGGRVAIELASRHPELVIGLVLMGVPIFRPLVQGKSSPMYRIIRTVAPHLPRGDALLERSRQRYGSADYKATSGVMRGVFVRVVNEEYGTQLAKVACPIALLWGANDTAAPVSNVERALLVTDKVVFSSVAPNASHDVHKHAPEQVRLAIAAVVEAAVR
jgi:pimeloyl-ACP methyl ester carboxylesterase